MIRGYHTAVDERKVKFGMNSTTFCYLDVPQSRSRVHGVVRTELDTSLGHAGARTHQHSHSFQVYLLEELPELAIGTVVTARIEAIAVDEVSNLRKLRNCYFNYFDAALFELYRAKEGVVSLRGTCCWPHTDSVSEDNFRGVVQNESSCTEDYSSACDSQDTSSHDVRTKKK